jgi:hypothetical protein
LAGFDSGAINDIDFEGFDFFPYGFTVVIFV